MDVETVDIPRSNVPPKISDASIAIGLVIVRDTVLRMTVFHTMANQVRATPLAKVSICQGNKSFDIDVLPDTGSTETIISQRNVEDYGLSFNKDLGLRKNIVAAGEESLICSGTIDVKITWLHHSALVRGYVTPNIPEILLSWRMP
eukprot:TCALIF_13242-PA protein Name:"Protein of unknown function" AED:0.24 eAED:0.46 QI:0/0/0/1/1/1/2/0/145